MTRPAHNDIAAGQQAWDADINDNYEMTFETPFPPVEVANAAALATFTPANYDRCIAATVTPPGLWYCDGSAWLPLAQQQAAEASPTVGTPTVTPVSGTGDDATINANFSSLESTFNTNFTNLKTTIDNLRTKLNSAGILA